PAAEVAAGKPAPAASGPREPAKAPEDSADAEEGDAGSADAVDSPAPRRRRLRRRSSPRTRG
ncbi:MAG: hypothetical protein QM679_11055, partial [Patulibacter sp.]